MSVVDDLQIRYAKSDLGIGVSEIALVDVYGLKNCKRTWGALIAQSLIIETLECTGGSELNQLEVDCLQGKMSENLAANCCP